MFEQFLQGLDHFLLWFFRLPDNPLAGFFLGLSVLALVCTLLGEITGALISLGNESYYARLEEKLVRMHNLSIRAVELGDKQSYVHCNTMANEYFGRVFFAMAAQFAGTLWPVPFALAWIVKIFSSVTFDLAGTGYLVGPSFVFIPLYILVRMIFSRLKPYLPWFKTLTARQKRLRELRETPRSWAELHCSKDGTG